MIGSLLEMTHKNKGLFPIPNIIFRQIDKTRIGGLDAPLKLIFTFLFPFLLMIQRNI